MLTTQREPKNVGVLLIDFSPVVREGLQAILTKDERIEVIGDASDGQEALLHIKRAYNRRRPVHVVLTETQNGGGKLPCVVEKPAHVRGGWLGAFISPTAMIISELSRVSVRQGVL